MKQIKFLTKDEVEIYGLYAGEGSKNAPAVVFIAYDAGRERVLAEFSGEIGGGRVPIFGDRYARARRIYFEKWQNDRL